MVLEWPLHKDDMLLQSGQSSDHNIYFGLGNATICDPSLVHSEVLREVTDICGEDPWGASSLPLKDIHLEEELEHQRVTQAILTNLPKIAHQSHSSL